ncbi:MAG: hypothetical protein ABL993_01105 [Vicinamibacterales bacterium]
MAHHDIAHRPNDPADFHGADAQYFETPPGAGYEHTDASVWTIVKFGFWLTVSAVVIHVGLGFMYSMLKDQAMERSAPRYPLASNVDPALPAQPRLQQFPRNEIYEFRVKEEMVLHGYGWADKAAGTVRIPIDQAMRLSLERGLPARAQEPGLTPETPGLFASDSSAGRVMERRRQ